MKILEWIRSKWQAQKKDVNFERRVIVTADDEGVCATNAAGLAQKILWKDVERVAIETNDSGPWGADFWWLIEGEGNRCCFPQGATGEAEMLELLPARFQGFRFEKFIEACSCTSNARFICWEKEIEE